MSNKLKIRRNELEYKIYQDSNADYTEQQWSIVCELPVAIQISLGVFGIGTTFEMEEQNLLGISCNVLKRNGLFEIKSQFDINTDEMYLGLQVLKSDAPSLIRSEAEKFLDMVMDVLKRHDTIN